MPDDLAHKAEALHVRRDGNGVVFGIDGQQLHAVVVFIIALAGGLVAQHKHADFVVVQVGLLL